MGILIEFTVPHSERVVTEGLLQQSTKVTLVPEVHLCACPCTTVPQPLYPCQVLDCLHLCYYTGVTLLVSLWPWSGAEKQSSYQ